MLLLDFSFSGSKNSDANIGITAILVHFEKTLQVWLMIYLKIAIEAQMCVLPLVM